MSSPHAWGSVLIDDYQRSLDGVLSLPVGVSPPHRARCSAAGGPVPTARPSRAHAGSDPQHLHEIEETPHTRTNNSKIFSARSWPCRSVRGQSLRVGVSPRRRRPDSGHVCPVPTRGGQSLAALHGACPFPSSPYAWGSVRAGMVEAGATPVQSLRVGVNPDELVIHFPGGNPVPMRRGQPWSTASRGVSAVSSPYARGGQPELLSAVDALLKSRPYAWGSAWATCRRHRAQPVPTRGQGFDLPSRVGSKHKTPAQQLLRYQDLHESVLAFCAQVSRLERDLVRHHHRSAHVSRRGPAGPGGTAAARGPSGARSCPRPLGVAVGTPRSSVLSEFAQPVGELSGNGEDGLARSGAGDRALAGSAYGVSRRRGSSDSSPGPVAGRRYGRRPLVVCGQLLLAMGIDLRLHTGAERYVGPGPGGAQVTTTSTDRTATESWPPRARAGSDPQHLHDFEEELISPA